MFTIKLYGHDGRRIIRSANSFTILADDARGFFEVTLHNEAEGDCRYDIGTARDLPNIPPGGSRPEDWPPLMGHAYIVNEKGRTVETLSSGGPLHGIGSLKSGA
ncbi:hypothetical protein SAMN05216337_1017115 [Bradyrhizobium brasilense]|uniref:Uncharacterized protein n=1 Tax=Bradyrhizobium brasilense TaxID=1419277 RepID=A0A1G6YY28_9BRAD|nr:hypothetical protein [Bradyrhizobium brasilense]SDD94476.1 hypothetical protein SAMN05216337_1017115 [Bradyrhizobium brasilense]